MSWILGVAISAVVAVVLFLLVRGELVRRKQWFVAARGALGDGWTDFAKRPSTDLVESTGKLDGHDAVFAADATTTEARLDVPLTAKVEPGRVIDIIVRESGGALEAGREDVLVGWDDEHSRLVFKTRAKRDAAETVKVLREESRAFQARLPQLLEEKAKERSERAAKVFGELTAANGRHKILGLGLALPPEEWELVDSRPEGVSWEQVPPESGDALPVELRLLAVATDPALSEEAPRLRLLERIAHAYSERLPDGSFAKGREDAEAKSGPALVGFPTAVVPVDHEREVVVEEERTDHRPYRALVHATFTPWAVSVLELVAPRDRAEKLLEGVLAGASFEKP